MAKKALGRGLAGLLSRERPARFVERVAAPGPGARPTIQDVPGPRPQNGSTVFSDEPETPAPTAPGGWARWLSLPLAVFTDLVLLGTGIWLAIAVPLGRGWSIALAALCVVLGGVVLVLSLNHKPAPRSHRSLRMPDTKRPRIHVRLTRL